LCVTGLESKSSLNLVLQIVECVFTEAPALLMFAQHGNKTVQTRLSPAKEETASAALGHR
jgi:hypothetical protein